MAPNQAKTPMRTFRLSNEIWTQALRVTRENDTTVTDVVREFLMWYLRMPGAKMPKRP